MELVAAASGRAVDLVGLRAAELESLRRCVVRIEFRRVATAGDLAADVDALADAVDRLIA